MKIFDEKQTESLNAKLNPDRVERLKRPDGKPVLKNGKPVGYIEAWDDIEQANQIFGFDGWSREAIIVQPIHEAVERANPEDPQKTVWVAAFWAKVRITVHARDGSRSIVREGCGAATSYQKTIGEAVENAIKAAETDAMKRALVTFGNQFGLALYDKSYKNVGRDEPERQSNGRARIDVGFDDVDPRSTPDPGRSETGRAPLMQSQRAPEPANSDRAMTRLDRPRMNQSIGYANGGG